MAKKSKLKKSDLDLNGDGKLDAKDKSIAAAVLATDLDKVEEEKKVEEKEVEVKEDVKKEVSAGSRVAAVDINPKLRKGDEVSGELVAKWKECGVDHGALLEK